MQQQRASRNMPDYLIDEEDNKPHQEPLPRAIARQPEPDRFEEETPDYFWMFGYWTFAVIIGLMGVAALADMYRAGYNWLLALSWTGNAVLFLGGLAWIQKYWLRR